jgi:hypothetical protein
MTRIYALLFAAALFLNGCATAGPIAIKRGLQDVAIAASDYAEIAADVHSKNWTDLAQVAEKLGWATVDCVLGDQVKQDPNVKANVDEFRRLHSVEFRAAGGSACRGPVNAEPVAPVPARFSYSGENPGAALARCDRACGKRNDGLATSNGCVCWRGSGRSGRWMAAR